MLAPLLATGSLRDDEQFLAVVALAALVFPLLGVARLLPWAVALLAGSVLVASEHGDIGSVRHRSLRSDGAARRRVRVRGGAASRRSRRIERRLARRLVVPDRGRDRRRRGPRRGRPRLGVARRFRRASRTLALGLLATVALLAFVAGLVARR